MYKSLLEIYSQGQLELLRGKMWWVADGNKPFLLKYASGREHALMELTDLKSLWVAKIPVKTLMEDKMKYAKSLQIKEGKDLMTLLDSLLSTSDSDPRTLYAFKEQSSEMHFTFKKMIKIFDFNWTFKLKKANCNPVELICKQLLSPLACALQAQSNRMDRIKRKFEQVEKDYLRKMTEMQKNLYKSPLLQDKQEWHDLLPKYQTKILSLYTPDKFSQFCFSSFFQTQKKQQKPQLPSMPLYSEHKIKPIKGMIFEDDYGLADSLLEQQLEEERQRKKKEKKIDFI